MTKQDAQIGLAWCFVALITLLALTPTVASCIVTRHQQQVIEQVHPEEIR